MTPEIIILCFYEHNPTDPTKKTVPSFATAHAFCVSRNGQSNYDFSQKDGGSKVFLRGLSAIR